MLVNKDTNIEVAVTTIIVTFLMKKLNFDTMYYGMLYTIVLYIVNNNDLKNYTFLKDYIPNVYELDWYYCIYAFVISIVVYGIYKLYIYITTKEYAIINLYDSYKIDNFTLYVEKHQEYYKLIADKNYGDIDIILETLINPPTDNNDRNKMTSLGRIVSQKLDQAIYFDDPILNIKGYYEWKNIKKEQYNDITKVTKCINVKYIVMYVLKTKDLKVDDIFKKIDKDLNQNDQLSLCYTKVLYDGKRNENHSITFYKGPLKPIDELETIYMNSFFHQEKHRLWKTIKTVCTDPEYYITRGQTPRISLLLHGRGGTGKSSLIYRIAQCTKRHIVSLDLRNLSKYEAYHMIQKPRDESYKKYILLFEEFDISIKELYIREQKQLKDENYDQMIELVKSEKYEAVKIKDDKTNDLRLRDLLEIFQGPIPFEQMIIMATTNKYQEIKEMCPELFRPGRLTPVHFDYINKETLQEISMYYFQQPFPDYLPDILTIPTSQIIELAFEALNMSVPHEYFVNHLNKLIRNIKD